MAGEAFVQAVYYRQQDGVEPVYEYCRQLAPQVRASLHNQIERLNMQKTDGPPLPFPHSSQVEGEFRELRCHHGKRLFRVIYRRSENLIVLLHVLEKRSGRLEEADIQVARSRWADAVVRMNPPRPARAFGHDAPRGS